MTNPEIKSEISPEFKKAFLEHHTKEGPDALQLSNLAHLTRMMALLPPNARGLEIGCFKGGSTVWFLQNGIEHLDVIDTFEGSPEHKEAGIVSPAILDAFRKATEPYKDRVDVYCARSDEALLKLIGVQPRKQFTYDCIYVDGSHDSKDVIQDTILGWKLLKTGGILIFDDYQWTYYLDPHRNPGPAIDFFIQCFNDELEVLEVGYQISVRKRVKA